MGLIDLPSDLLQGILFRAARGATADRVAELLSVCKLFRCEINNCSVHHATHARPDANQPLKLQDCAALKSLVVDTQTTSLFTQHFTRSGTAVAVQALTSLTVTMPELVDATWCEIESIIKAAPALAVVMLVNAPDTLFTCLGSLHALISLHLSYKSGYRLCSASCIEHPESLHSIMHLTALQDLRLSSSGLQRLPHSIGRLTALHVLSLANCRDLVELPDSIGRLTALQTLDLSRCTRLEGLPDSIEHLTALQMLNLFDCRGLVGLPNSIGQMSSLTKLDLGCDLNSKGFHGFFTNLPDSIGQLAALKILSLAGHRSLARLPDGIGHLTALQMLDLTRCRRIARLPDNIGQLTALQNLNLGGCSGLVGLPDSMGQLTALRDLDLSKCIGLVGLPDSIGKLTDLRRLSLYGFRNFSGLHDSIIQLAGSPPPMLEMSCL